MRDTVRMVQFDTSRYRTFVCLSEDSLLLIVLLEFAVALVEAHLLHEGSDVRIALPEINIRVNNHTR